MHMCPSVTGHKVGETPEENMEVQSLKDRVLDEKKRKGESRLLCTQTKHLFTPLRARISSWQGPGLPGQSPVPYAGWLGSAYTNILYHLETGGKTKGWQIIRELEHPQNAPQESPLATLRVDCRLLAPERKNGQNISSSLGF